MDSSFSLSLVDKLLLPFLKAVVVLWPSEWTVIFVLYTKIYLFIIQ